MTSRDFSDYPSQEVEEAGHRHPGRAPFSPIKEVDETISGGENTSYPSRYDKISAGTSGHREHSGDMHSSLHPTPSPKHSPHPHSPSSSSSGHSSPRSPPTHPPPPSSHPPPLPHHSRSGAAVAKQRPSHITPHNHNPHSTASHGHRGKMHDQQYGYHGDPNKMGSNWKSQPVSRGHSRVSPGSTKSQHLTDGFSPMSGEVPKPVPVRSEHEIPASLMIEPDDRGSPSGASNSSLSQTSQQLQQRHHDPLPPSSLHHSSSSADHAASRQHHHHQRFSPEGIQAETGERGGSKNDARPSRTGDSDTKSRNAPGRSSLASVSYDSQARSGPSAGFAGEGGDGRGVRGEAPKEVIQTNHVALRVAQFNQSNNHSGSMAHEDPAEEEGGGGGGRGSRGKEKTPSPNDVRSPVVEKAAVITLSPGSSEEELTSINKEDEEGAPATEENDGGYFPLKSDVFPPPPGGNTGSTAAPYPQLSQPTYLSKTPPTSSSTAHAQSPFSVAASLSQPHPAAHPYDSSASSHPRLVTEIPFGTHAAPHMRAGVPYDPSTKPHPLPPSSQHHQKHPSHPHQQHQPPPTSYRTQPGSHEYHQRSHDHHMTTHPGSYDHHMTAYTMEQQQQQQHRQYTGYRQQGPGHPQQRMEHGVPAISKQSLIRAHEAAADGDLGTLRHMLSSHEVDVVCVDDTGLTLAHTAAMTNQIPVMIMLINEGGLPLHALHATDDNFVSPAMLAIENGCVEVLQWLVEEGKVPLVVRDAGGETLVHHAAHHGQAKCLMWLLKVAKPQNCEEPIEFLDNFGVTPAHFAAQQGHLECLQLMIDHNYSVLTPDKENQKPIDWADAMGQTLCVRYLFMHETCWALSADVSHLSVQLHSLQKENAALKEKLGAQEQEYQQAMGKMHVHHEDRISKMREQYVDLTASLLKDIKDRDGGGGGGGGGESGSSAKQQKPKYIICVICELVTVCV